MSTCMSATSLFAPHALLPDRLGEAMCCWQWDAAGVLQSRCRAGAEPHRPVPSPCHRPRDPGPAQSAFACLPARLCRPHRARSSPGQGGEADSFWSWRTLMYRFAGQPDGLSGRWRPSPPGCMLEMLEAGYTSRVRVPLRAPPGRRPALCRRRHAGALALLRAAQQHGHGHDAAARAVPDGRFWRAGTATSGQRRFHAFSTDNDAAVAAHPAGRAEVAACDGA